MKIKQICASIAMVVMVGVMSMGTAQAVPVFDIDFYGGDSNLLRGVYDTGTNLDMSDGMIISADVMVSGIDVGNGLIGWALLMEHGEGITVSNFEINRNLWPLNFRNADFQAGYFSAEGLSIDDIEGDDLLLFSFDLTVNDRSVSSILTLWDFDQGGVLVDMMTAQGDVLDANQLPVDLASINSVPVPGSILIFLAGLTGLAAIRKKESFT